MDWQTERVESFDMALLERLEAIEKGAFGEGGLNPWVMVPFIRHGEVYVISNQDRFIGGVAEYMRDFTLPERAYLFGLSVDGQLQGQGLGSQLLLESLAALQARYLKEVELTVDPRNETAVALYEKIGFQRLDYRTDEYGPGEHRWVMLLDLTEFEVEDHG